MRFLLMLHPRRLSKRSQKTKNIDLKATIFAYLSYSFQFVFSVLRWKVKNLHLFVGAISLARMILHELPPTANAASFPFYGLFEWKQKTAKASFMLCFRMFCWVVAKASSQVILPPCRFIYLMWEWLQLLLWPGNLNGTYKTGQKRCLAEQLFLRSKCQ